MSTGPEVSHLAEVFLSSLQSSLAVTARDVALFLATSCVSLPGATAWDVQTKSFTQSYNLCYNPFFTATLNSQIKDAVCLPRANRTGEKYFPQTSFFTCLFVIQTVE